jgi:acyl carrier protein
MRADDKWRNAGYRRGMDRDAILERLCTLIAPVNHKGVPLGEETRFADDLELDSLTVMDLVANMEDEWDINIPLNLLPDLETIGQVADAVARLRVED